MGEGEIELFGIFYVEFCLLFTFFCFFLQYKLVVFTGSRVETVSETDGVDGEKCVDIQRFKNTPCKYKLSSH